MRQSALVLLAVSVSMGCVLHAQSTPTSARGSDVVVRGTFVRDDGQPVTNKACFADNVDAEGGPGLRAGENGVVTNPQAFLDSTGQLKLVIPKSFLSKARTITVFCFLNPMAGPLAVQGRTADGMTGNLAYVVSPGQREVNLGRVQVSDGKILSDVQNKR